MNIRTAAITMALVLCSLNVALAQNPSDVSKVIVPFVQKHCVQCHGPKKQEAEIALHAFDDEMDEYLTAIRDLEQRIERAATLPEVERPEIKIEEGVPKDFEEHCRLLCDLLVLALQADITRISTFALANELSDRTYPGYAKMGHRTMENFYLSLLNAVGDNRKSFGVKDTDLLDLDTAGPLSEILA